ncbi:MAG: DUF2721 domain-containing protein [Desulfobulbaceae bacterium]|nr:MAG: DUF2721 domain-containing protein [Desulfobulbaceae bacterium]
MPYEITLTTPALFFPAVSLLLVAYTNRFVALSQRIRTLHSLYQQMADEMVAEQIVILRRRVSLIRNMQACGVAALFCCVLCIAFLFFGFLLFGRIIFGLSLALMLLSLALAFQEILISEQALKLELRMMEKK